MFAGMSEHARNRVLLVGWSGADWAVVHRLLDEGKLPVLEGLVDRGAVGRLGSLQPMETALLWTSLATGERAADHGVFRGVRREGGRERVIGSGDWERMPVWRRLSDAGRRVVVANWPATHPAEAVDGLLVSDGFGAAAPGSQAGKGAEELNDLRIEAADIDGDLLKLLVPLAAEVDQAHDDRLARLAEVMAGNFNAHSAVTWGMERVDWDFAAVAYSAIGRVARDYAAYEFPLQPGVREEDVRIFGEVVENCYRLHDAMLGRLLQLAGKGVTTLVVSEHGFRSGADRPRVLAESPSSAMAWRREYGILVASGQGVAADSLVHGATLLDVVPTVLDLLGVEAELAGRVLFGEAGRRREATARTGEIEGAGEDIEWDWCRVRALLDANRPADAALLLDELVERDPERADFRSLLALTFLRLGLNEEVGELVDGGAERELPTFLLLRAEVGRQSDDQPGSRELLDRVADLSDLPPGLTTELGLALLRVRRFGRAEEVFARLLSSQERSAVALAGMAYCRVRRGRAAEGEALARESVGAAFHFPWGHYVLGIALAALGRVDEGIDAFERALEMKPDLVAARWQLIGWLRRAKAPPEKIEAHRAWFARREGENSLDAERAALRKRIATLRRERTVRRDLARGAGASDAAHPTLPRSRFAPQRGATS